MSASQFDPELYKCKAILLEDDETVLHGFYANNKGVRKETDCIWIDEHDPDVDDNYPMFYEINPYTICRNTGIKIKSEYVYEFDLVEFKNGMTAARMGYVDWDDYSKAYVIRTSLNSSQCVQLRLYDITVIGNIMLHKVDADRMQAYSDESESVHTPDVKVECRSTQRLNRIARQFLPK